MKSGAKLDHRVQLQHLFFVFYFFGLSIILGKDACDNGGQKMIKISHLSPLRIGQYP
jgi:hypothetical protein